MGVCCSVEEALEYQATWAAFALQSKVRSGDSSHGRCSMVVIDARFLQDLRESAAAAKSKQRILYDNLGESARNKAKL